MNTLLTNMVCHSFGKTVIPKAKIKNISEVPSRNVAWAFALEMPQFSLQYGELRLVYFVTHKVVCDLFTDRLEVS